MNFANFMVLVFGEFAGDSTAGVTLSGQQSAILSPRKSIISDVKNRLQSKKKIFVIRKGNKDEKHLSYKVF